MACKNIIFITLMVATVFGVISAEMPEEVPRRLLDSATLKLYEATKMAQGFAYGPGLGYYYYGYGSGSGTGGRYNAGASTTLVSLVPGATGTAATNTQSTTTSTSSTGTKTTSSTGTNSMAPSTSGSVSSAATTNSGTQTTTTTPSTIVTVKDVSANGGATSVVSALAAIMAGLVYALAF